MRDGSGTAKDGKDSRGCFIHDDPASSRKSTRASTSTTASTKSTSRTSTTGSKRARSPASRTRRLRLVLGLLGDWRRRGRVVPQTGDLVSLSEQNLVDCVAADLGCDGGLPSDSFAYMARNGNRSLDTEAAYPYEGVTDTCRYNRPTRRPSTSRRGSISRRMRTSSGASSTCTARSASHNAAPLQFYQSGVLSLPPTSATPPSSTTVLLVGWGNVQPTSGKRRPVANANGRDKNEHNEEHNGSTVVPYWKLKNSWGKTWADYGGYFYVRRGVGQCGVNTMVTHALV